MKNALLIIDAQNDFCLPTGALSVPGADKDMERLANFIKANKEKIDYIGMTQDSHHPIDISHPSFWQDKDGNFPNPFTIITSKDVDDGVWTPRFFPNEAVKYIHELESQGEFPHCIWPEHCVIGTTGAAIVDSVMDSVREWSRLGKFYGVFTKGTYPMTEHFGAFRANVPVTNRPETQINQNLIETLEKYDRVYFAGEARSHCVANTLRQAIEIAPELAKKFVILEDCMSAVPGFETLGESIYDEARKMGIEFKKSSEIKL
jgi:nicotinamidase/pyrazinamidase